MQRNNSKRFVFISIICLLLLPAKRLSAQFDVFPGDRRQGNNDVLVSHTVDTSGVISKFGPNRFVYVTIVSQFGGKPGPQIYGAQTNWWSGSLSYGVRTKLKLFYWNSIIMDADYRYDRFSIRQNTPKLPPLSITNHVRERISLHNVSFSFCDRINFRKRGNVLGTWFDFGVYGDWVFRSTNVYVDRHYDSNSSSGYSYKVKSTIVKLPYVETLNYGITARFGGESMAIFAQWRMNNIFNYDSPNNRDLPKLTIGIEVCPPWE